MTIAFDHSGPVHRFEPVETLSRQLTRQVAALEGEAHEGRREAPRARRRAAPPQVPPPAERSERRSRERARSRLDLEKEPMPIGSVVIVDGPGRGSAYFLTRPMSRLGRGDGQDVQLAFGDGCISRNGHAVILYDRDSNSFALAHGGNANPTTLNGAIVRDMAPLKSGDRIGIGETTLMFTPICGDAFAWDDTSTGAARRTPA